MSPPHLIHLAWFSLGLPCYFAFHLPIQVMRLGAPLNQGCAVKFSLNSQNLSGPLKYNICLNTWAFLVNKLFQPTKLSDSDTELWPHLTFFFCAQERNRKYYIPGDENQLWIFCFSQRPNRSQMLGSHFQYRPTHPAKILNTFQDRIAV